MRKLLILSAILTLCLFSSSAMAVSISDEVGGTAGGSDSWTNNIVAVNLTASNSGTLYAIGINWESGGTFNCELCLYNTTNETESKMPGKLIASSDYVASPNLGWEYRLMNGSNATAIVAGSTYWASWTCSGAKKAYFNTLVAPGTTRIKNIAGGNCPATYPADAGPNTQQTNMRINYTLEETTTTSEETTTSLSTTTTSTTIKPYGDCCPDITDLLTPSCVDSKTARYFGEFQNKSYEVLATCPYGCDPKTGCNPSPLWLDFATLFGVIIVFGAIVWFIFWIRRR